MQSDVNMGSVDLASLSLRDKSENNVDTVDFSGRALKLDNESSAKPITDAITACKKLVCLNLEGNTLGVEAAKAIAKCLESQPFLSKALWKDLFTGRMKNEIPQALTFLSSGLILAKARLVELDLSDNAFGPVGIEGVVGLLKSPVCYSLQELRLNNNGLGITGGKMLAKTLMEGLEASKAHGQPMSLRVFICGRNRLENEAATALSAFFKAAGTLEHVAMPQNGIYYPGITALSQAFECNKNLRIINLNDNTFTEKGAAAMGAALKGLKNIQVLNFGDCLLKRQGAMLLADALSHGQENLQELHLGSNEIDVKGALRVANVLRDKKNLKVLDLNGNQLGTRGCDTVVSTLKDMGLQDALSSLSEDESDEEEFEDESASALEQLKLNGSLSETSENCTPQEFVKDPTIGKLRYLGAAAGSSIVASIESLGVEEDEGLRLLIEAAMKIASTASVDSAPADVEAAQLTGNTCMKAAFELAVKKGKVAFFTNILLVHLGLIKSEDKSFKLAWSLGSAFLVLEYVAQQHYFNKDTVNVLHEFLVRPNPYLANYTKEKEKLLSLLTIS